MTLRAGLALRAMVTVALGAACSGGAPKGDDTDTMDPVDTPEPIDTIDTTETSDQAEVDAVLDAYVGTWYLTGEVVGCTDHFYYPFTAVVRREGLRSLAIDAEDVSFDFFCDIDLPNQRILCPERDWVIQEDVCTWDAHDVMWFDAPLSEQWIVHIDRTALLREEQVLAYRYDGVRYDCGSKLGLLQATVSLGKRHPEIGAAFTEYLKQQEGM